MPGMIPRKQAVHFGGLEINALLHAGVLPSNVFDSGRVTRDATPIYDTNGQVLFYRSPIVRGHNRVGYADLAAFRGFGAPLLAVSYGLAWDEKALLNSAAAAAHKAKRNARFDQSRFVAYSYPKIAVQFLASGKEVLMLELGSWAPVPPQQAERQDPNRQADPNFQRWSFINEMPAQRLNEAEMALQKRIDQWQSICPTKQPPVGFDPRRLKRDSFQKLIKGDFHIKTDTREVACFNLHGQQTNVWCVGASVQMLLDYYRYAYDQTRVAQQLGLGTLAIPNGLPYSRDNDVVTALETMSSNALTSNMNMTPNWTEFTSEIQANRPLISFIPGHSRCVAGYTSTSIFGWYLFRGLLVFDPWPPTTGVITRWENYDATTYRRTFTAHVTTV